MARLMSKKTVVRAVKAVVGVLVLVMVARHIARTWSELRARGETLTLDPGWLALSVGLYLLGLCGFGIFFGRILKVGPTPVGYLSALRAYLIGHLGKYVPGKALVVLMRVGLLTPYGARAATSAFAALYETLVMMASGGLLAGVLFAVWPAPAVVIPWGEGRALPIPLALLGLGMGVPLLVLAQARVFPRLLGVMSLPFPNVGPEAHPRFSHRLLVEGFLWSIAGWVILGLSQVVVVRAMGASVAIEHWPLVVASVALATVAGFAVAIFPGGLVVREGVLMVALAPTLGADRAVVAALVLRLAWVLGELGSSAALAVLRPPLPQSAPVPARAVEP